MEKKAVAGPVYHSQSSQEEEEEGEGLHQAELKAFDHHMPIQPSRRAQGRSWGPEAPPEVMCPQSREISGNSLVPN